MLTTGRRTTGSCRSTTTEQEPIGERTETEPERRPDARLSAERREAEVPERVGRKALRHLVDAGEDGRRNGDERDVDPERCERVSEGAADAVCDDRGEDADRDHREVERSPAPDRSGVSDAGRVRRVLEERDGEHD